ncbi:uncharacterized protein LOC108917131 [Anoplophora glabripennis]|uniref:uncharacterized protein LOC108917131 n=1 Tax=Anoplophora glabripennis TaxID=217634 RepID=UPI000873FEA5|nr:uncharacterized protein LOC108917131 [Anoplophora glabripennis]
MLKNTAFVCFLCVLVIALGNCQNELSNTHKIKEYFSNKCYGQTHDHMHYTNLSNEFSKFEGYLQRISAMIPDRRKDFCEHERRQINNEFHTVVKYMEPCLSPQEKYMSEFLKISFGEFLHFLCHNNGEYTKRLFSPQNEQCRGDVTSKLSTCSGRIFKPSSGYLTKKDICEDMSVAEKCLDAVVNENCASSPAYKDLVKTFFRYISKPCSGCVNQISILLLALSVFLPYLFSEK